MFKRNDYVKYKDGTSGIIVCRDVEPDDFYVHIKYVENKKGNIGFLAVIHSLEIDHTYSRSEKLKKIMKNVQSR